WQLTLATSSAPQIQLSSGTNTNGWSLRSVGGNFYFASTSASTLATSSLASLTIDINGNVGIATTSSVYAKLSVSGNAAADYFTAYNVNNTSVFAGSINANNGAVVSDSSTGVTSVSNLEVGALSFDADAGQIPWIDMPVTSDATLGTVESYT